MTDEAYIKIHEFLREECRQARKRIGAPEIIGLDPVDYFKRAAQNKLPFDHVQSVLTEEFTEDAQAQILTSLKDDSKTTDLAMLYKALVSRKSI